MALVIQWEEARDGISLALAFDAHDPWPTSGLGQVASETGDYGCMGCIGCIGRIGCLAVWLYGCTKYRMVVDTTHQHLACAQILA